jgi:putative transposon-encoded protein
MTHVIKTKKQEIVDYWTNRQYEQDMGCDWSEAHERCWRCGYKKKLERCHIIPNALEGKDIPSNFVLLCGACHVEAPNVTDSEYMWEWIKDTKSQELYDQFEICKFIKEYTEKYGDEILIKLCSYPKKHIMKEYEKVYEKVSVHFGQSGKVNTSTKHWMFKEVCEKLER